MRLAFIALLAVVASCTPLKADDGNPWQDISQQMPCKGSGVNSYLPPSYGYDQEFVVCKSGRVFRRSYEEGQYEASQ